MEKHHEIGIGNLLIGPQESHLESESRLRWNFLMGMVYGAFFNGGLAFSDPSTVLPVFLGSFTDSKTLIGLSAAVMSTFGGIGSLLPQLFVASKLESKVSKRPLLRAAISVRVICWGLLALITYWFGLSHPLGIIVALLFLLTLFTFMGGIAVEYMFGFDGSIDCSHHTCPFISFIYPPIRIDWIFYDWSNDWEYELSA